MASKPKPTLYLVDGTAQLFRAYFAIRGLTNDEGLPTNAVFGFTSMLRKLLRDEEPDLIAVAFDLPGEVFRHQQYADYKANRPPTPEDLDVQVPYAKRACDVLGVTPVELEGYEADDLIATYTRHARETGMNVVVVASDKDLLQLVGDGVEVLNPSKELRLDPQGVVGSFGVAPDRVRDVLGLMGDSVDNIPGVPGVGEKTAVSVVSTFGDMESVIARSDRFVALFDARDALLEAIVSLERSGTLDGPIAAGVGDAGARFAGALSTFLQAEPEGELGDRYSSLESALQEAALDGLGEQLGTAGKQAAKPLKPLKKELKAMDRGSAKKSWYAIHEHADQARMSKELATLHEEVPVPIGLEQLELRDPDREKAHALFSSMSFGGLTAEFESAREEAGDRQPASDEGEGRYETVLEAAHLQRIVQSCRNAVEFAVDTETDSTDPLRATLVGISLAWDEGSAAYIPLGHDYVGAPSQLAPEDVRKLLGPLLADAARPKVAQNLMYDAHVLRRHGLEVEGWGLDTMVAAFLLNSSRGTYSMDSLAEEFLGLTTIKYDEVAGTGSDQKTLNRVEVERVTDYAAEDADVTLRLARQLRPRLESAGLRDLYDRIDGPLLPVLVRMEAHGIRVDVKALEAMSQEMEQGLVQAREEIHRLAGTEFNVDSPKQLREILFEKMGLKPKRKTVKSKVASTDAQTLEELAAEHPIAERILEYRELAKLKGTYVDALPRLVHPETGRVHTSYHPTGAATGRLSSSNPNLQNIPVRTEAGRQIRSAFVPQDGHLFLASDYSQVELRVLAHLCGDAELIKAFRAGEDIHRHTAAKVFGVVPDLVSSQMRRRAKAVNFGILYGMSQTRLAREQGISRTEARQFIDTYFERFASVQAYIEEVRDQALRDGAVRTLFGRVRYFPALHGKVNRAVQEQALRAAVNTTIQGTAADLMKLAMLRVDEALEAAGSKARMLLQVHDELLLELPEAEIETVSELVRRSMEEVYPLEVPLSVDQKVGRSWLEAT
jgi:DNA polymerase-1